MFSFWIDDKKIEKSKLAYEKILFQVSRFTKSFRLDLSSTLYLGLGVGFY
tara:strand:+ start:381 stop:530 length:150 start_codon:yes stop_codon:yes gene_type:complete